MRSGIPVLFLAALASARAQFPQAALAGPYSVSANRILDRHGRVWLLRGTDLAPVTLDPVPSGDLGALSASALVTIRQRLNMNAVRLPFSAAEYLGSAPYRDRVRRVVRDANRLDLLVILAPRQGAASSTFWAVSAADFRDRPNVFFAAAADAVPSIRAAGARQPVIVPLAEPDGAPDTIYKVDPPLAAARGEALASLAARAPVRRLRCIGAGARLRRPVRRPGIRRHAPRR